MASEHKQWIFNDYNDTFREKICQWIINSDKLNTTVDVLNAAFKKIRDNIKEIYIENYNLNMIQFSINTIFDLSLCHYKDLYVSLINAINQGYDLHKIVKLIGIDDGVYFFECPKNSEILQIYQDLQSYYGFNITEIPLFKIRCRNGNRNNTNQIIDCRHENCLITPLITTQGKLTKAAIK